MNPEAPAPGAVVVAMDVGGTRVKSGLLGADGTPGRISMSDTGRADGPEAVVERVLRLAERLCEEAERAHGRRPAALGAALPGIVDEAAGTAVYSANLGWRDVPIAELLRARVGLPVAVRHDVRAGALAEARIGAGRGAGLSVFLPVGTGIGGAVVIDGRVLTGAHARAGELGHVVIDPNGPLCPCGAHGCLETYAAAPAIARAYARGRGAEGTDAAGVAALVARGDPVAVAVWDAAVDALAAGITTMSAVLDPERVVIGGGLSRAGAVLLDPLRAALARRATFHVPPELVAARLTDGAACLGAGLAAWDHVRDPVAAP